MPYFTTDGLLRNRNELMNSLGMLQHLEILRLQFGHQLIEWNMKRNCSLNSVRKLTSLKALELAYFNVEREIDFSNRGETTAFRFPMRSLEAITLNCVYNTRKFSISGQLCTSLKSLKLDYMIHLIEVDLIGITTLECLELLNCRYLREVVGNDLQNLEMFRIKECWNMKELPNFVRVSCLKRIFISGCRNLQNISAIERLKGLKKIWIAYCPKLQNIKAIEQLKGLKRIWVENCPNLQDIGVKELKKLKRIFIADCPKLQNIEGIEFLICLESIIITACPKLQNVRGIEELKRLNEIIISDNYALSYETSTSDWDGHACARDYEEEDEDCDGGDDDYNSDVS